MNNHGESIEDVRLWERKAVASLLGLLAVCFSVWAGVVWNSGQDVVRELRAARLEDAQYRLVMERRVTILEQRQAIVLETLRKMNQPVPHNAGEQ